jgi:endoglucanase Acf2
MRRGLALLILCACSPSPVSPRAPSPPPDPSISTAVGAGWYVTKLPDGEQGPSDKRGAPVTPKVTADFAQPPQTNDWWSSLIWAFDSPYSQPMWAHPLAMQAEARGLAIAYPTEVVVEKQGYRHPFEPDLLVGAEGLEAADARVARYSDWTVTAAWGEFRATFGHGLPFVFVERTGGAKARVEPRGKADVWKQDGDVVGLTVRGHDYALLGAKWKRDGGAFVADTDRYTVALLPDRKPTTLARFKAAAVVSGGHVEWAYDRAKGEVHTKYVLEKQGEGTPLVALYRHQWQHTDAEPIATYTSPRGEMKLVAADTVTTTHPFRGVLPFLPILDPSRKDAIRERVDDAWRRGNFVPPGMDGKKDAYWTGKALQKLAILAHLADQTGHTRARADFLQAIRNELEDWFDGRAPFQLYYDGTWRSLLGAPAAYFSGAQLNDHHFHYGYFVFAAATVAHFDPAWAARDRYGEMIELLLKDAANWDRTDERFPFLRHFDVYAGHSWANGPALFAGGNNEESSSEDVNFAVGAILWGAATGDEKVQDLGAYLYANLTAAIDQYWFDVDDAVFPEGFERPTIAILWGDGGRYDTWWDPSPIFVHGINMLPITGGSLYLGRRPEYVKKNWDGLVAANRGEPLQWRDVLWMYLALGDAAGAAKRWGDASGFTPEFGASGAAIDHWIRTLAFAGLPDMEITADSPTAVVLGTTHIAYNPGGAEQTVRFSDGVSLTVPPRSYAHSGGTR